MASILQRILGLGFLMGSVILGMTLAQSQVGGQVGGQAGSQIGAQALDAAASAAASAPGAPAMPTLSPEQAEAARKYFEQQQQQRSSTGSSPSSSPYPYSGSPIHPPTLNAPAAFVPSEIITFQSSLAKHVEPRAIIHTTLGDIELRLYSALAPNTVKNFLELARGEREFSDARTSKKTRRPFYNGLTIHKVVSGEYVQMGCPMGNGRGGPGYTIPDEIVPQLTFEKPYVVAMAAAREGVKPKKDSNGSQFFITLSPQKKWDGVYTVFGAVTKGQKILDTISAVDVGPTDRPIRKVFITAIDVIDENSPAPAAPVDSMPAPVSQPAPASVEPPIPAPAPGAAPEAAPAAPPASAAPAAAAPQPGGLAVPPQ